MQAQFQIRIKEKYEFQKNLDTNPLLCLYHSCIRGETENAFVVTGIRKTYNKAWNLVHYRASKYSLEVKRKL